MSEELKPCRQCGGPANVNNYDASIECMDCTYEEGDAEEWNTDRPITKADIDEYCKANNLVMVPEEPDQVMLYAGYGQHYRLATSLGRRLSVCDYKAMVAAYKEK